MTIPALKRMSADEFLGWAQTQSRGSYELVAGEIVAMAPERADHARAKFQICLALKNAIKRADVQCEAFVDSLAVRINKDYVYEPDAIVNCGARLAGNVIEAPNPVIVVEVLSPSTQNLDKSNKFIDYFSLPQVHHYVVVELERGTVIHHRRMTGSTAETKILKTGEITFNPPGLTLDVREFLELS